jgi:hypothetical protein
MSAFLGDMKELAITILGMAVIAGLVVGVVAAIVVNPAGQTAELRQQIRREARTLWLTECDRPLDACARSWDEIPTLRHLYIERVDATRKSD